MPRPSSALWVHFRKDGTASNKRAICKYCQYNMCGLIIRMRLHLARKCLHCPPEIKAEMQDNNDLLSLQRKDMTQNANNMHNTITMQPAIKKARRNSRVTGMDEKTDIDGYVAKAILGAALPVKTVENPSFVKLIKRLAPMYELPNAFALASSGVDLEYTEVQLKLRAEFLDAPSVCLGIESWAWSSIGRQHLKTRSIISCTIKTPNPGVFAIENTGELPHSPEVIMDKVENVMTQVGTGRVSAIVMDTSASMAQASIMLQAKYPDIIFLISCADAMDSMMTELLDLPMISTTLRTCNRIAAYFSNNHLARASFARVSEQITALESSNLLGDPSDLSPIGKLECLFSIERYRDSFELLLTENEIFTDLEDELKDEIMNLSFWDQVSTYVNILEPYMLMLKTFDVDYPLLSTFYHRFTQLWDHIEKYGTITNKFHAIMTSYWEQIKHPAMYTAYILDPRYPASNLNEEGTTEVLSYLKRAVDSVAYADMMAELTRFTGRSGMFEDTAIWEAAQKCSPINWWKGFIGGSCPHLQAIALRTLCFPAASGLSRKKRAMFEKIFEMNQKYMSEEQASKAALVYLNTNFSSVDVDFDITNPEPI